MYTIHVIFVLMVTCGLISCWIPLQISNIHQHHQYHRIFYTSHRYTKSSTDESHGDDRYPGGEVVGSTGKIGSYILHKLNKPITSKQYNTDNSIYPQSLNVAAVPRGVSPGCLSTLNTPIYAAVPSSSTQSVWESTIPHRRKDLVFLCNCIPSRHLNFGD